MSRARDLYEQISQEGYERIQAMVTNEETEELFLDYKQVSTLPPYTKLSDDDRKNYSKALSGFGNAVGGIIVWGVDCRKQKSGGDVPTAVHPIQRPLAFKTLLDGATSGLTLPPLIGVESSVVRQSSEDVGCVVTYIPEGRNEPVRAVYAQLDRYYTRVGSDFVNLSHGALAGMFGRRPAPELRAALKLNAVQQSMGGPGLIVLDLMVTNVGRGLAPDLYVSLHLKKADLISRVDERDATQWSKRTVGEKAHDYEVTLLTKSDFPRMPPGEMTCSLECPRS